MCVPSQLSPTSVAGYILGVLEASEKTPYIGEPISQLQHSLQCANQAAEASPPVDEATQVAALLHDVGQFAPAQDLWSLIGGRAQNLGGQVTGESVGRVGHELLGAKFLLALGFSPKVARLVESHVAAKRYLCAVDEAYYDRLSDASKKSLTYQGGPMNEKEKEKFGSDAWCREMCQLRMWDDEAKVEGLEFSSGNFDELVAVAGSGDCPIVYARDRCEGPQTDEILADEEADDDEIVGTLDALDLESETRKFLAEEKERMTTRADVLRTFAESIATCARKFDHGYAHVVANDFTRSLLHHYNLMLSSV